METIKTKKILICISEMPYPARRNGISIRYLPILEHFGRSYDIDLLLILEGDADKAHLVELESYCNNLFCYVQKKSRPNILRRVLANLRALMPGQQPLEIFNYNYNEIKSYVLSKTKGKHYDVKLSVVIAYAELIRDYVSADRFAIDCIDSRYAHMMRVSKDTLVDKYKLWLMRRWESRCIASADTVSFVSPMDIDILYSGGSKGNNIKVIPNGIYIDDYSCEKEPIDGFVIGFLGNMDYHPNIQASLKLAEIFKSLKVEIADLRLLIIGRSPSKEIVALQDIPGIIVTGGVETIWPYVNATDLFVFPMSYGAGLQNKLLDVMYAGRPVVSSNLGNSGVGARGGVEVALADTDGEIKEKILELYHNAEQRECLSKAGNEFIQKQYEWDAIFKQIELNYFFAE